MDMVGRVSKVRRVRQRAYDKESKEGRVCDMLVERNIMLIDICHIKGKRKVHSERMGEEEKTESGENQVERQVKMQTAVLQARELSDIKLVLGVVVTGDTTKIHLFTYISVYVETYTR